MNSEGSIVVGWLSRLAVILGVLALLTFDGVALLTTNVGAADQATTAASAAADAYRSSHTVQGAYDAAVAAVAGKGDTIDTTSFRVTTDGRVTLHLHKVAATIWLQRVGPLAHYGHVTATGDGTPSS